MPKSRENARVVGWICKVLASGAYGALPEIPWEGNNSELIGQLSAGRIDILAPGPAQGDRYPVALQMLPVHFNGLGGGLPELPVIYGVVFDKVDLGWSEFTEFDQGLHGFQVVIDALPDHVFIGNPAFGPGVPELQGLPQVLQGKGGIEG